MLKNIVEYDGVGDPCRIGTVKKTTSHLETLSTAKCRAISAGLEADVSVPIIASEDLRQPAQPARLPRCGTSRRNAGVGRADGRTPS